MRSIAIVVVLALSTALVLFAATPAKKKTTKAPAAKAANSKATKSKAAKSKAAKTAGAKKSATTSQATRYRRSTQKAPAPERYMEIQHSLAEKGYFAGPVNGAWGPDSVEALKRFQRDQNIGDDGKLGSLSLIALGLGPKRGASGPAGAAPGLPPP